MSAWTKLKEAVIHRDGKCMNCGAAWGLTAHHIKTRGAGGTDEMENLVALCVVCHKAAHDGYLVPGRRITLSEAKKKRVLSYEGDRVRIYLQGKVKGGKDG